MKIGEKIKKIDMADVGYWGVFTVLPEIIVFTLLTQGRSEDPVPGILIACVMLVTLIVGFVIGLFHKRFLEREDEEDGKWPGT